MTAKTRIYVVNADGRPNLVRAASRFQARAHVAKQLFRDTHLASQDDLVKHLSDGLVIEDADTVESNED